MELRKAVTADKEPVWEILQEAIERRRLDGSRQWQDGYPNYASIEHDLERNAAYVIEDEGVVVAYAALIRNDEPAYNDIQGQWLTQGDFLVVHRVAVSNRYLGKGVAGFFFNAIEAFARAHQVFSIKMDTNFDNAPMLHLLNKYGYTYCGEVFFRGSSRKAFEKILNAE